MSNLPITNKGSFPQWFWTLLVSHSTYSHIRIWIEPVWIEWGDECAWPDILVECSIEGVNNERVIFVEVQDHRWVLVHLILSPCLWYRSSLSISLDSIRIHACLLNWEEEKVIEFVMELCGYFDIALDEVSILVKCVEWLHPFDRISIDLLHHLFSLRHTHQLVRHHLMHGSTIQVLVNAFLAHSCLFLIVNVDLSMSFHDLSDPSSKVLQ